MMCKRIGQTCWIAFVLWAIAWQAPAQDPHSPAPPDTAAFRAAAAVQLRLEYQGTTEGIFSRGLHLFGASGGCQSWYRITDVIAAPVGMGIEDGDRLWLRYTCDGKRRFRPEHNGATVDWAEPGTLPYAAHVWLRRDDIEADKATIWAVPNPHDWFAPVADQGFDQSQ